MALISGIHMKLMLDALELKLAMPACF